MVDVGWREKERWAWPRRHVLMDRRRESRILFEEHPFLRVEGERK